MADYIALGRYDADGIKYSHAIANIHLTEGTSDGTWTLNETNGNAGQVYVGHLPDGSPVFSTSNGQFVAYNNTGSFPADLSGMVAEATEAACFAQGTCIATASGPKAVECLDIGDTILNAQGQEVRVEWIGRQTLNPVFAALHNQMPIRIIRGALGDDLPHRDLYVSPDHALLIRGCLVHADALVNGRTITRMQEWRGNVEYFHIETQAHEIILAEGAPAETFVDNEARQRFDNAAEFATLYPKAQPMIEMDLPRIIYKRQLPAAISKQLDAIANELMGSEIIAA